MKTLIFFVTIFILGNVVISCFEIKNGVKKLENSIKSDLGAIASVEFDPNNILPTSEAKELNYQPLTEEIIQTIGEMPEVKTYSFAYDFILWSDTIRRTDESFISSEDHSLFQINIYGIENLEAMNFEEKVGKIVAGRLFEENELKNQAPVLVISNEFAENNNLKVGDVITTQNIVKDTSEKKENFEWFQYQTLATENYELEIIGIYQTNLLIEPIGFQYSKEKNINDNRKNMLFTSNALVSEITRFYDDVNASHGIVSNTNYPSNATYILNSPDQLIDFKAKATKVVPENYIVTLTTDAYYKIAMPFQKLNNFANVLFLIGGILSLIIFFFIIKMNIQERFSEFGILLSVGVKKGKIIFQVCSEIFLIALIALSLSLFTGKMLATQISDAQLAKYSFVSEEEKILAGLQENDNNLENTGYLNSLDITNVIKNFGIELNFFQGIILISCLFLLVFCVSFFSLIKVFKLNPKDILLK